MHDCKTLHNFHMNEMKNCRLHSLYTGIALVRVAAAAAAAAAAGGSGPVLPHCAAAAGSR